MHIMHWLHPAIDLCWVGGRPLVADRKEDRHGLRRRRGFGEHGQSRRGHADRGRREGASRRARRGQGRGVGEERGRGRGRRSGRREGPRDGAGRGDGRVPARPADVRGRRHARRSGQDARIDRRSGEGERHPARRLSVVDRRAARRRHRPHRDGAPRRAGARGDRRDVLHVRPRLVLHGERGWLARWSRSRRVPDVHARGVCSRHGGDAGHRNARRVASPRGAQGHAPCEPGRSAHVLRERRGQVPDDAHRQADRRRRGAARLDGEDARRLRFHARSRCPLSGDDGRDSQRPCRVGCEPRAARQDRARGRAEGPAAGVTVPRRARRREREGLLPRRASSAAPTRRPRRRLRDAPKPSCRGRGRA